MHHSEYQCPICKSSELTAKYEAKYIYSYLLDSDAPGLKNTEEFLPFLYDRRDQTESRQYIECNVCKTQFPCYFNEGNRGIDFHVLHKAIQHGNTGEETGERQ